MRSGSVADHAPAVSVIMPAYDVAASIERAIGCVQAQTFTDWELIVVDDASPDDSGDLARRCAKGDARIRVIAHEVNRGLAAARNTGIAHARGQWVWMPDSDDAYDDSLLSDAIDAASRMRYLPDAVIFGYVEEFYAADGAFLYDRHRPMQSAAYECADEWHGLVANFERSTHYGYVWNKLYRLDHIRSHGLAFESVRLIEDIVFNVAFFDTVAALAIVGGTPYHYVKREGKSLTNANEYGAAEYWSLHERRMSLLRSQLAGWGVLAASAPVLGSLYARFIVSTLERSYHATEHWDSRRRSAWLHEVAQTSLFNELIPVAKAEQSRMLALVIHALQRGHVKSVIAIARAANLSRLHAYGLFTRVRSGR